MIFEVSYHYHIEGSREGYGVMGMGGQGGWSQVKREGIESVEERCAMVCYGGVVMN